MMKPRDASRDGDLLPASRPLARLAGRAVLAVAAAVTLAAAPAAAWAQAAAGTSPASAASINCPPPNPRVQATDSVSDC